MKEKLKKIFKEVLKLDDSVDVESLNYRDYGWSSIAHMVVISEIENEFDLMLETDDIIGMSSFAEAVKMVERNLS